MIKTLFGILFGAKGEDIAHVAYSAREVWLYAHTDPKTGSVTHKPVLIYHKASEGVFWGLPLVKARVKGKMLFVPRQKNGKKSSPLSAMRTLKAGRLVRRLGKAGEKEFSALNSAVLRFLAFAPLKTQSVRPVVRPAMGHAVRSIPKPVRAAYNRSFVSPFSPYVLQTR